MTDPRPSLDHAAMLLLLEAIKSAAEHLAQHDHDDDAEDEA